MKASLLLFIAAIAAPSSAWPSDNSAPLPIDKQEQLDNISNATRSLNSLQLMIDQMSEKKRDQCMRAFGSAVFCGCLAKNSPVGVTFVEYVAIITSSKESLNYSKLPAEKKKLVDATRSSRDQCVK